MKSEKEIRDELKRFNLKHLNMEYFTDRVKGHIRALEWVLREGEG